MVRGCIHTQACMYTPQMHTHTCQHKRAATFGSCFLQRLFSGACGEEGGGGGGGGVDWIGTHEGEQHFKALFFQYSVSLMLTLFWIPGGRSSSMSRAALLSGCMWPWPVSGYSGCGGWVFWQSRPAGLCVPVYLLMALAGVLATPLSPLYGLCGLHCMITLGRGRMLGAAFNTGLNSKHNWAPLVWQLRRSFLFLVAFIPSFLLQFPYFLFTFSSSHSSFKFFLTLSAVKVFFPGLLF